jgi:hypothetical protein
MADDDDFVIEDSENFNYSEDNKFSHESLIMLQIKKCMDAGSVELIEGWWENKVDKNGNVLKTYHPDTRKVFINCVKTLIGLATRDYEGGAKEKIDTLVKSLDDTKKKWLEMEWKWWTSLSLMQQRQMSSEGKQVVNGYFNKNLDFDNHYFEEETEIYRKIFTEINILTKTLRDFRAKALRA